MILSKIVSTVLLSTTLGMSANAVDIFPDQENSPFSKSVNFCQTRSVAEIKEHLYKHPQGTLSENEVALVLEETSQLALFDKYFFASLSTQNVSNGNQSQPIIDWCKAKSESVQNNQFISLDSPNHHKASFFLGAMALHGLGDIEKDPLTAIFFFGSSMKYGYEPALMGYCHALIQQGKQKSSSRNHNADYGRALKIIKNTARKGSQAARYYKARLLQTGLWVMPRDPNKAVKIMKSLAKQGYEPAIKDLSYLKKNKR